jgi:cell division septation protein DedD
MNELADDSFHEIQLSAKQLVFLVMTATALAVAIFLCGVQVGRGVRSDRAIEGGDPLVSSTPPPAATPSQAVAGGGPPAAEPPAPAPEPDDELSYAKRLQADQSTPPSEKLKPRPETAPPPSVAAPRATGAPLSTTPQVPQAPPAPPAPQAAAGRPGGWIVQLMALQDRGACATLAARLASKGYPAFVLDPAPGSPKIFRVQVGGYADRDKADQAARRLEKEEQLKPYVRSR